MKLILTIALVGLSALNSYAAQPKVAYAFETLTVDTSTRTLTSAYLTRLSSPGPSINPDTSAFMTVETATLRWTINGSSPTSTSGHKATDGDTISITGYDNLRNFRFLKVSGSDGSLQVTYER